MSLQKWVKLSSEVFHENKWWQGIHDRFRLPNGKEGDYFFMSPRSSVIIIAIDSEEKILLHRQYRYLFDNLSLELPCGGVEQGQTIEEAAALELIQETGFRAGKIEKIGQFLPNKALSDLVCNVFVARNLSPAMAEKDETEDFELVHMSPQEVDKAILSGAIDDGMVIAGWTLAKPHLKIKK